MSLSPVGREVDRIEGRLKVTGSARYSADHRPPGTVHAHVVTSTVARGTVRSIDTAAALAAPGVLRVYAAPDPRLRLYPLAGQLAAFSERYAPLQDPIVRFHGQIVAMVVAETVEQARDAAALVTAAYDAEPARTTLADGPRVESPPASDGSPSSHTALAPGIRSIDEALAASEVVVEAESRNPVQHHAAMEPHSVLAAWDGDRLTVHAGAQLPAEWAMLLAARLGVLPEDVRLVSRFVGGAFGARVVLWSEAPLAAAAARETGRPVLLTLTREQMFTLTGHRSHVVQRVRLGATRDGVLTAVSHECDAEAPAVGGPPLLPAHAVTDTLYRTPNLHIAHRAVALDLPACRAMRAPNESPGAFALETAMDELAVATGVDPVELRLRNDAPVHPRSGLAWSSRHLADCFRVGVERFGWSRRRDAPGTRVDGDWLVGTGTAAATYPASRGAASVRLRLLDDGTATVSTATADPGTGAWTMVAITGADALGIALERVTPEIGDTALPPGAPSIASSATTTTVALVVAAARDAVAALKRLAVTDPHSPWHGADPAELRYERGRLVGRGRSAGFGGLLTRLGVRGVDATASGQRGVPPGHAFASFGAHFCEVRVNRFTYEVRVSRFTSVLDVGRVLNAQAARSQLVGGVVFGIGHALLEDDPVEPATGRLACANLADYLVPVNADVPPVDVHWLDRPDPVITGPLGAEGEVGTRSLGARGVAEIGNVGSAAAVANAVFDATGVRVRDLPITLDKLLEARRGA
ncbi:xanthine dehydrogenase family protein molybdopterin-binding subunit [Vallicoccus soli]|uniref:Xanthine dehydrogenase family protein molybdopterin-binding subunit n=1 Tax=Vallicoccus soli TaxID=2339232 RepID=A0A3A3Z5R7_9ACTN|nr:xanthine dehydrogenase family protein molybdopterin-binding subunit [Vallicoccus soli]RJK95954.1 xanthine dehydrogenase family protein molybdopterin-binding subunit [Vallicoccus soli]